MMSQNPPGGGARTLGRYRLLHLLGTGGSGRVYRAEQRGPGGFRRTVALKVLDAEWGGSSGEAVLAAQASHPNLVTLYDYGREDGLEYLAMELVEGPTLSDQLRMAGSAPGPVAVQVGLEVLAALEYLHTLQIEGRQARLVHRDVKPGNVLLDRSGTVKLSDLGIAKATALATEHTATGITKGTPAYMSPEQLRGEPVGPASDLFSFGVLFSELLTGRPLFRGRTSAELMINIAAVGGFLRDPSFPPGVEEALPGARALVRACLAPDPSHRPASAGDLARDLSALAPAAGAEGVERWVAAGRSAVVPEPPRLPRTLALETPSLPSLALSPLESGPVAAGDRQRPASRSRAALPALIIALAVFAGGVFVGAELRPPGSPPSEAPHAIHHERTDVVVSLGEPAVVSAHTDDRVGELRVLYRPPGATWASQPMTRGEGGVWTGVLETRGAGPGRLDYYFSGRSLDGSPVKLGGPEHPWSLELVSVDLQAPASPP